MHTRTNCFWLVPSFHYFPLSSSFRAVLCNMGEEYSTTGENLWIPGVIVERNLQEYPSLWRDTDPQPWAYKVLLDESARNEIDQKTEEMMGLVGNDFDEEYDRLGPWATVPFHSNTYCVKEELRFPLGTNVECFMGDEVGWKSGVVVGHHEKQLFGMSPYKVRLNDKSLDDDERICTAPEDDDRLIRLEGTGMDDENQT